MRPNHQKTNKRLTVGVLPGWQTYTGTFDSYLSQVFRGIQTAAAEFGANVLFGCSVGDIYINTLGRTAWPLESPNNDYLPIGPWNCDGLIVVPPFANREGKSYFRGLCDSGYPIIFAGSAIQGPSVVVDNEEGVWHALHHLYEHGHRDIAFIGGRLGEVDSDSQARLRAYRDFLDEFGLEYRAELVAEGFHTYQGGKDAISKLLGPSKGKVRLPFTALMASNDRSADGAIDKLQELGFVVPHDIAVIGFDDRLDALISIPQITSVRLPMFELGYQSMRLMCDRIYGKVDASVVHRIPTRLIVRESCGCLASAFENPNSYRPDQENLVEDADNPHEFLENMIIGILQRENPTLGHPNPRYLVRRLLMSLIQAAQFNDASVFLTTFHQILEQSSIQGEDLFHWHQIITLLQSNISGLESRMGVSGSNIEIDFYLLHLLDRARIMVSEVTRGQAFRNQAVNINTADLLGNLSSQFFRAVNESDVLRTLSERLPDLGIKSALIGLFEASDGDPYCWVKLIGHSPSRVEAVLGLDKKCKRQDFQPTVLYADEEPVILTLMPITIGDNQQGFVIFESPPLATSAMIMRLISAAWRGVDLHNEAVKARELAEERRKTAEEANRLKGRFLSMVSHELRTPLNLIAGLTDMILKENQPDQPEAMVSRADLERIHSSAQHLDGLIRDVLDLARLDVGQLSLVCEPLQIDPLIQSIALLGEELCRKKGLHWRCEISPNLPRIWGDRTRLRQVMVNLIQNAVKFTDSGEILLTGILQDNQVKITISDTGMGIPQDEQDIIFDEFSQSNRTSDRGFGGLGLGLSICKRLIELHGGEIQVCSNGEDGSGSSFSFTIPALYAPEIEPQDEWLHNEQYLLILVDESASSKLNIEPLREKGYSPLICVIHDLSTWMQQIPETPVNSIFIETRLAQSFGWEIIKLIKDNPETSQVPFFVFSTNEIGEMNGVLELDYMMKPLVGTSLEPIIRAHDPGAGKDKEATTLLIVDDDPGVLDLHTRLVKNIDPSWRIIKALNGKDAIDAVRHEMVDLILLDLLMPEMNGFEVIESLRREDWSRKIPIIVITGQVLTEEDMQRLNSGFTTILSKGVFNAEETMKHIRQSLERRKPSLPDIRQRVLRVVAYIHAHFADSISRSELANLVGLSERHLDRSFQLEMGVTPITYLNRFRVRQARNMLENGEHAITEVALNVGFTNSGYFTRVFRDEVGVSPRNYARSFCSVKRSES